MSISAAKQELRKLFAAKLSALPKEDIAKQSAAVAQSIFAVPWFKRASRISIYVSTDGEIITDDIISYALEHEMKVFIPQFEKGNPHMKMLHLSTRNEFLNLDSTLWNIRQFGPGHQTPEYHEFGPLDVVLLPGVCFTPDGRRLGHGRGYYDKFLAEHLKKFGKMPYLVALALKEQLIDELPTTSSDVAVDFVLAAK